MSSKDNSISIDPASEQMLESAASQDLELVWDRYRAMQPQCGYGQLGLCCKSCVMGPCRIDPFGQGPQKGICGATADIIAARNLMRMIAAVQPNRPDFSFLTGWEAALMPMLLIGSGWSIPAALR